ncbi:MAG: hypothetical protein IJH37_10695 [Clostridia bacterium]|nr:hypothetical protein [Clostridia bacterium]
MNFRKLMSGIAALTVAFGSFAGLSMTAEASTWSQPYTLQGSERIGRVLIGTKSTLETGKVMTETFDSYGTSGYTSTAFKTFIPTRDSGARSTHYGEAGGKNIYGLSYGLAIPTAAGSSNTYEFTTPVTAGKLVLRGDILNAQRNEFIELNGTNTSGNPVSVFKFVLPNNSGAARPTITSGSSTVNSTSNTVRPAIMERGYGITLDYVVIDLTNGKIGYKYDGLDGSGNVVTGVFQASLAYGSVTGLTLGQASSDNSGTQPTFDEIALYTVGVGNYTVTLDDPNSRAGTVTFDGNTYTTPVPDLINGTYSYSATVAEAGYQSIENGTVTVNGSDVTETLTFPTAPPIAEATAPPGAVSVNYFGKTQAQYSSGQFITSLGNTSIPDRTLYGNGYTFYITFDFFLPNDGQISFGSNSQGGLGTEFRMGMSEIGYVISSGGLQSVSGTLSRNTWYRCTISSDLHHYLALLNPTTEGYDNYTSYWNKWDFAITDTSGASVASASNVTMRNSATNNASKGGVINFNLSTTDYSIIKNVKTYYVPDATLITCSSPNVTVASTAAYNDTVTISAASGYILDATPTVTRGENNLPVTVTDKGDGTYSFTMPAETVTVTASAAAIAPLTSFTVSCETSEGTVLSTATPDVTDKSLGDTITYSPYAYILYNGTYYKYDGVNATNGSVPQLSKRATSVNETMTVLYTAASDVVYYQEVNANEAGHYSHSGWNPDSNTNASGGMDGSSVYGQTGRQHYSYFDFNVPTDGTYTITANTVGALQGKTRTCALVVDYMFLNERIETLTSTNGGLSMASGTLDLQQGTHRLYFATDGVTGPKLDYFVVEKVATLANLHKISKSVENSNFRIGKNAAATGATVTFETQPNLINGFGDLVVTMTPAGGSTQTLTPVAGVYSFTMPNADVRIDSYAKYSIPVEIDSYDTSAIYGYEKGTNITNGDGWYARGFTFSAYSGPNYAIDRVSVTATGATNSKYDDAAYAAGTTAMTASGLIITGEAVFGIVIWTGDTTKIDTIKDFDPANFTVTVE